MTRPFAAVGAILAGGMALGRLAGLVEDTYWYPTVGVAITAGAMTAILLTASRVRPAVAATTHLVGAGLYTYWSIAGALDTPIADRSAVGEELTYGIELLRFGAAPVLAAPGLVGIIAVVCWLLAALVATSLLRRRAVWAIGAPLVFYLQLSTVDRRPTGVWWMAGSSLLIASLVLAVGDLPDSPTGRAGVDRGRPPPRRSPGVAVTVLSIMAMVGMGIPRVMAEVVPPGGTIHWRSATGLGGIYGGGSALNPFVGLRQSVISLSNEPVFFATLSDSAPPVNTLYWNLITLDNFDGTNWLPTALPTYQGGQRWEDPDQKFTGPAIPVAARVRVADLGGQLLPTLYSPTGLTSPVVRIADGFLVRADGSVRIDLSLRPGWEYEFQADVPQPDLAALASTGGALSPIFQQAARAEVSALTPTPSGDTSLPDRALYTRLPSTTPAGITELSRQITRGASTPFERAVLLEAFFRDSELFTYSTEVSTGHSALDLEEWLTEPGSRNFRTGYCEQFATAMAVMARTLDLPSRVVLGFTPGLAATQPDGTDIVVVTRRNAHAWVELWMDGQGWVRFDPTPRGDGINPATVTSLGFDPRNYLPDPRRSSVDPDNATRTPNLNLPAEDLRPVTPGSGDGSGTGRRLPSISLWMLAMVGVVGSVPFAKWIGRRRRIRRIRTGDISAAWEEITLHLAGLGEQIHHSETPHELAARTDDRLQPLAAMMTAVISEGSVSGDLPAAYERASRVVDGRGSRWQRIGRWLVPLSLRRR